jgi:hypothetical protein
VRSGPDWGDSAWGKKQDRTRIRGRIHGRIEHWELGAERGAWVELLAEMGGPRGSLLQPEEMPLTGKVVSVWGHPPFDTIRGRVSVGIIPAIFCVLYALRARCPTETETEILTSQPRGQPWDVLTRSATDTRARSCHPSPCALLAIHAFSRSRLQLL